MFLFLYFNNFAYNVPRIQYVIDASDRSTFSLASTELNELLSYPQASQMPILIVLNKMFSSLFQFWFIFVSHTPLSDVSTSALMEEVSILLRIDLFPDYLRALAEDYKRTGVEYAELSFSSFLTDPEYMQLFKRSYLYDGGIWTPKDQSRFSISLYCSSQDFSHLSKQNHISDNSATIPLSTIFIPYPRNVAAIVRFFSMVS